MNPLRVFNMEFDLLILFFLLITSASLDSLNIRFLESIVTESWQQFKYILYYYCNFCQIKICIYSFFGLKYNSRLRLSTEAEYS